MPADGLAIELSVKRLLLLDRNANVLTMIETTLPGILFGTDFSLCLYFWDGAYVTSTILSR
jgi:hypothetical protein